jgi:hypothetical protein
MATSSVIIEQPIVPDAIKQSLGQAAASRLDILEQKMTALQLNGDIKPATMLNLSPFTLSLASGLIQYKIPPCPPDKRFATHTVTGCISYPIYKGNQQMSDKSIQAKFDVNIVLPIQQLMEFKHYYMGEAQEDLATKQGGVAVFEGDGDALNPKSEVRAPYFVFRKRNRYIVFETRILGELVQEAEDVMKRRCNAVLDQATRWYDGEKGQRANIQFAEYTWHDFALRKQWITQALPWRNTSIRTEDRCPRCAKQYVSKTGICECSFVFDPFKAYMEGEIVMEHVRMNTLTKGQWVKVKEEQKRRDEARA